MVNPSKIKEAYRKVADQNEKFRRFLKNNAVDYELDAHFLKLHNMIFAEYDCCACGNCCKLYDILVNKDDIERISQYLGLTENDFIEKYLAASDEGYIMKEKPCRFLDEDGKCKIYEIRPSVCRDFPYTDKPYRLYHMYGVLSFAEECPVVFEIIERLKKIYKYRSNDCQKEKRKNNRRRNTNEHGW
ncbi:MAG: YkgJ family cysteine cluster protein [Oscillospiraceae bacterium]|nr:YkgJ family cysteine cluster protein [Oscillospiraceae bacterium]